MISKVGLILLICVLVTGCVRLTDESGKTLKIGHDSSGFYVDKAISLQSSQRFTLNANVKGSIYETGELMSVFGTCLSDEQLPLPNTTAIFNAWYPNGTQFVFNSSMQTIQPGYFLYQANMSNVQGTYLTEMDCYVNTTNGTQTALAWGEWQNPFWVHQINDTAATVQNLTVQIGNLSVNMSNSFNITWSMLNSINQSINVSFTNLSSQIYQVGLISNSTYNNTNYIIQLIQNLSQIVSPNGTLNHTEDADTPVYMSDWGIKVTAINSAGKHVSSPDSECFISTTQTSPAVAMTPQGEHYVYDEVIHVHGSFTWLVTCQYA